MKLRKSSIYLGSFLGAVGITVAVMMVSFLGMLFASGEDGRRETLFHALYFESVTRTDGVVSISFGLTGYYFPIIVIFVCAFLLVFGVCVIYNRLIQYREKLIKDREIFEDKDK